MSEPGSARDAPIQSAEGPWNVVDYATANAALIHPDLRRALSLGEPPDPLTSHLLNLEGEAHRALRAKVVTAIDACTPAVIPLVGPTASTLLQGVDGTADLAGAFVRPLVLILLDQLLGLTGDHDADLDWWHQAALALEGDGAEGVPARISDELAEVIAAGHRFRRHDVVSLLIADDTIEPHQLESTIFFAFSAGYVNTVNFLGRALLALAANPGQYQWLRERPGSVTVAVEELLRYAEPPSRASRRMVARDTTVGPTSVSAGALVNIYRAQANRDPERFADPNRLDLQRTGPSSLAFGAGTHFCPGASLVRVVADLVLLTLIEHVQALDTVDQTNLAWDFADELVLRVTRRIQP